MNLRTLEKDGFEILIQACPEDMSPDDLFDWQSDEERKEFYDNAENNMAYWFIAEAQVSLNGINLCHLSIGGCSYASFEEFLESEYCKDLIDEAIKEAEETLIKLLEQRENLLKNFSEKDLIAELIKRGNSVKLPFLMNKWNSFYFIENDKQIEYAVKIERRGEYKEYFG